MWSYRWKHWNRYKDQAFNYPRDRRLTASRSPIEGPLKPLELDWSMVPWGSRGAFNRAPLCREA